MTGRAAREHLDQGARVKNLEEEVRRLRQHSWGGAAVGATGPGPLVWLPLTDIWTPASGVEPNPFGSPVGSNVDAARYAHDQDFLYLAGGVLINSGSGPWISTAGHPTYNLGNTGPSAFGVGAFSDAYEDDWSLPVALSISGGVYVGYLAFTVSHGGIGSFSLVLGAGAPTLSSGVSTGFEMNAALAWHLGPPS